jgi:hypothetical protein
MSGIAKIIFSLLFLWLVMGSCETDLHLKLKEGGGQLVLFAFPTADSTLLVHLSKSVSHSSVDNFERIYDGYIIIIINGTRVDSSAWPYSETWAPKPNISLKEGDHVRIMGGNAEGLLVVGETILPRAVSINGIKKAGPTTSGSSPSALYNIQFSDPPGTDNFYQLILTSETRDSLDQLIEFQQVNFAKTDDVFYIRDQEGSLLGGIDFLGSFSDYLIQGKSYNLSIGIPELYLKKPGEKEKRIIRVHLMSLSEAYYNYLRSRVVAEYNYDVPVVDPIKTFSNIGGGLGLVGGISIASDSLVIIGNNYE